MTSVVNVRKKELQKLGYRDLLHWLEDENHVYIGRNMSFYVPGAVASKWANPFTVKKYGRDGCLEEYRKYITSNPVMVFQLAELSGKTLGCWCAPDPCHGDVLVSLMTGK
jgi:hypothetical protein